MLNTTIDYPFTEEELEAAADEWGCNCGPSALAFALQKPLEEVRYAIPDFEQKGYTSPTMIRIAGRSGAVDARGIGVGAE